MRLRAMRMVTSVALLGLLAIGAPALAETPTAAGPLNGAKLLQVTLPSRDLARSVGFYRDVLGLPLLFQVNGAAFFDMAGVRLRLELSKAAPAAGAEIYFDDPQLSDAQRLKANGVVFAGPAETVQRSATGDLKLLEFFDPDGNVLALMGEVSRN